MLGIFGDVVCDRKSSRNYSEADGGKERLLLRWIFLVLFLRCRDDGAVVPESLGYKLPILMIQSLNLRDKEMFGRRMDTREPRN